MDKIIKPLLIKKGAEAHLYLANWHGRKVVIKKRLPKNYRLPVLDEQIRIYRTTHEPQLMHEARKAGVPTPVVFFVDAKNATIIMEFVEGKQIKQLLSELSEVERLKLCKEIGELIGKLHNCGIVHGDLTTSNMIQNPKGKIFFVDFGLGEKTKELEAIGVDLHLMKRALQSVHFRYARECFNAVIKGYSSVLDAKLVKDVLEKVREIEKRGRYVAERKCEKDLNMFNSNEV
ncbi:MAG: KEOPS complex kinase/ATPase Bud32 [Nitrososphaerota archaeon]|nr:KEOPS complex kinase/ATPase Bud32 [Candidatus Bathyarchaeota archaeon]MDW8023227.1 KEOPS complex kinase/ATPase Bud32 [Nitrososphaerota archaeon]